MKVVALAGGTGSAKLLRGLSAIGVELTVVANVGDNFWIYGMYVCPDIDIAMYTLAGVASREKGWGIEQDTFRTLAQLGLLGEPSWFALGDRDLATQLVRCRLLREGRSLTEVTDALRRSFHVAHPIIPVSDDPIQTTIVTARGSLHIQEFWVRDRGRPSVKGVEYRGASRARITNGVRKAIAEAEKIIICPANPVTSIGPMLAVPGFADTLFAARAKKTALSPMIGRTPFSGPAGKLMKALEMEPDSSGVARAYSRFLDTMIIDRSDAGLVETIRGTGVECFESDTFMMSPADGVRLAKEMLEA